MDREDFKELITFLKKRITSELPGRDAHIRMIPRERISEFNKLPSQYKRSSVLLLLYPSENKTKTVLIQRPVYSGHHSGQISLPGGKFQEEDIVPQQTALREAEEEVGINPKEVHIIGPLTELYIPPSNFLMMPYLAYCNKQPAFKLDMFEVESIMEVDVACFSKENLLEKDIILHGGRIIKTPYFNIQEQVVWGATGMVMSEMGILLDEYSVYKSTIF